MDVEVAQQPSAHQDAGRGLHQLNARAESAGRMEGMRDGPKQRAEHDRVVALLRRGEAAFGGDPREFGLAELGQNRHRGLVGECEQGMRPR